MRSVDVVVLGAGITGIGAALHLQGRGRRVLIVDVLAPGEVSSRGNTGLVPRDGFAPLGVPTSLPDLVLRWFGRGGGMRLGPGGTPGLHRFLRSARASLAPAAIGRLARSLAPLQEAAAEEHVALARAASAFRFFRRTGWLKLYRSETGRGIAEVERHFARIVGVPYQDCGPGEIARLEPELRATGFSGVFWPESQSVSSPGGVTKAYARLFRERGGEIAQGDPASLEPGWAGWTLRTAQGRVAAAEAVLALGAGSAPVLARFGLRLPLAVLRNRHCHFRPVSGVALSRPVSVVEAGFVLTPMERGIRLVGDDELVPSTAADAAEAGSAAYSRAISAARGLMPLGAAAETEPVVGRRLLTPDGLPVIGRAPGVANLWLQLGHGTQTFALAPAMGRLLADLMDADPPFVDPVPFVPARFVDC